MRGDAELTAALRELGKGPRAADIDAAAKNSLAPMLQQTKDAMRANRNYVGKYPAFFPQPESPRDGGFVDAGVAIKRSTVTPTRRTYKMGATSRRARYLLHLLEFGTMPHYQPHFHGGWQHPGAAPNPAMVPAYENNKAGAISSFSNDLLARIEARANAMGMKFRRSN